MEALLALPLPLMCYCLLPISPSVGNESNNQRKRSKWQRKGTNFGPYFITAFLVEHIDFEMISGYHCCDTFNRGDSETYEEANNSEDGNSRKESY